MRSPIILATVLRTLATPEPIKDWSLTSLKEKLIKIGAKVVSHGRYVADRGTRAAATTGASMKRSTVTRSSAIDRRNASRCQ